MSSAVRKRRRRLSQQDLRTVGARPGLVVTRYAPDGERATVRQLAPEASGRPSLFLRPGSNKCSPTDEEGEA